MLRLSRRAILGSLAATATIGPTIAEEQGVEFIAGVRGPDGIDRVGFLDTFGAPSLSIELPARAHGGVALDDSGEAILIARRPGSFAVVLDVRSGLTKGMFAPPDGHHFYGHGARLESGLLALTENRFGDGTGVIGLYDPTDAHRRVAERPAGNIGPHEVVSLNAGRALAIANGGVLTHPDLGRAKLNLDTMRSSIDIIDANGEELGRWETPDELRLLSLRHLAVGAGGTLIIGGQWQGGGFEYPPLVASCRAGEPLQFHRAPERVQRAMNNYCGSVAVDRSGRWAAITAPRGGLATLWRVEGGSVAFDHAVQLPDVCGVAPLATPSAFRFTTGEGLIVDHDAVLQRTTPVTRNPEISWDNHIVST